MLLNLNRLKGSQRVSGMKIEAGKCHRLANFEQQLNWPIRLQTAPYASMTKSMKLVGQRRTLQHKADRFQHWRRFFLQQEWLQGPDLELA